MVARPIAGLVSTLLLLVIVAAPAQAAAVEDVQCSGKLTDVMVRNLTVPNGGTCIIRDTIVTGRVSAASGSYFQAIHSVIVGDVAGIGAQTLFVEGGSNVLGSVRASKVAQVFLFASRVRRDVIIDRATDQVFICGSAVERGSIEVIRSARDIYIGGPRSSGCGGNSVRRGNMTVRGNRTDVQLVISGNRFPRGNLIVSGNTGPSDKIVQGNSGGRRIACQANAGNFKASQNRRWKSLGCRPLKR